MKNMTSVWAWLSFKSVAHWFVCALRQLYQIPALWSGYQSETFHRQDGNDYIPRRQGKQLFKKSKISQILLTSQTHVIKGESRLYSCVNHLFLNVKFNGCIFIFSTSERRQNVARVSHRHLAMVGVFQSEVVSLRQVEMDADQVKQHFAGRALLGKKERIRLD